MDSPTSDDPSPVVSNVKLTLNPSAPLFFPNFHHYYITPPPIYFISTTNLPPPPPPPPPPPSIFVYYPLWHVSSNPNTDQRFLSIQEVPQLHSQNPSQEFSLPPTSRRRRVFARRGSSGYGEKLACRRRVQVHRQLESNGDHITTVMLRNIPNKYTREMMIDYLDTHCEEENKKFKDEEIQISAYDFLYLPIDFKSEMNKGYAFVNFTNAEAVAKFKSACNHTGWTYFSSSKILEIAYARIQGKDELVKHFQHMTYPFEAYSAVCFNPARSGPNSSGQTIMVGRCTEPVIVV